MDGERHLISFVKSVSAKFTPFSLPPVQIGAASETLSEWADDEAGLEAVQKVVDSLDDIYALQDPLVEADVLRDILRDDRLHMLLQVGLFSHSPSFRKQRRVLFG